MQKSEENNRIKSVKGETMCVKVIELLRKEFNLPIKVCDNCLGDGEITTFCGHDVTEYCRVCDGNGYLKTKKGK